MPLDKNVRRIVSELEKKKISYAIITGKYEQDGTVYEQKEKSLLPDLDIVFFDISPIELHNVLLNIGLIHLQFNTYKMIGEDGSVLPIDIYIEFINTGYYFIFPVRKKEIVEKGDYKTISEKDYIIYQFLEPLIKFSGYKARHRYRLKKYLSEGYFTPDIKESLCKIIGCYFASYLINSISNETDIDTKVVKLIKLKLLFKHGNFLRMLKRRIFNYGKKDFLL